MYLFEQEKYILCMLTSPVLLIVPHDHCFILNYRFQLSENESYKIRTAICIKPVQIKRRIGNRIFSEIGTIASILLGTLTQPCKVSRRSVRNHSPILWHPCSWISLPRLVFGQHHHQCSILAKHTQMSRPSYLPDRQLPYTTKRLFSTFTTLSNTYSRQ